MTALSINLPYVLAEASQQMARKLGISRMQFIRLAVAHELQRIELQMTLEEMAKGPRSMHYNIGCVRELEELEAGIKITLPEEKDEWWRK